MAFVEPGAILAAVAARSKTGVPIFKSSERWGSLNAEVRMPTTAAAACEREGRPQGAEEGRAKRKWKARHEGMRIWFADDPPPLPPDTD
jgi:hypothetical protein